MHKWQWLLLLRPLTSCTPKVFHIRPTMDNQQVPAIKGTTTIKDKQLQGPINKVKMPTPMIQRRIKALHKIKDKDKDKDKKIQTVQSTFKIQLKMLHLRILMVPVPKKRTNKPPQDPQQDKTHLEQRQPVLLLIILPKKALLLMLKDLKAHQQSRVPTNQQQKMIWTRDWNSSLMTF